MFLVAKIRSEQHHRIQDIRNSLSMAFHLEQIILNFMTSFHEKGNFRSEKE